MDNNDQTQPTADQQDLLGTIEGLTDDAPKPTPEPTTASPPAPPPVDPQTARGIDAVQREEKRAKASIAQEVARLRLTEDERAFLNRVKSAGSDPAAVLEALGIQIDEQTAKKVYRAHLRRSGKPAAGQKPPAFQSDPDKLDADIGIEELRAEVRSLKQEISERQAAEEEERVIGRYLDDVTKAVSDKAPLVKSMLSKRPERARAAIRAVANRIAAETGLIPDHDEVIETLENERRAELEDLGVDVTRYTKPQPPPAAESRKSARTLSNDLSTPQNPRVAPKDRDEEVEDVLRGLESGQLE